jgi:hypothetical protein
MTKTILEQDCRLSRSLLWKLPPSGRGEPSPARRASSVALAAGACAKVVFGWLRDCHRAAAEEPLYILEIGAGSGRFARRFLAALLHVHGRSVLRDVPFRYILTSPSEPELAALRAHPALQPFVESDHLDFACFDPERDRSIRLLSSGEVLSAGAPGPMAVIADHAFDRLPHDVYTIEEGRLHERLVTLASPHPDPDPKGPGLPSRLEIAWASGPLAAEPYGDPDLDAIVHGYRERLAGTSIAFPIGALEYVRALAEISGGRLLFLSTGEGCHCEAALLEARELSITARGVSMMANHHAVGDYLLRRGGHALHTPRRRPGVELAAFVLGCPPDGCVETRQAFEDAVERGGPAEVVALQSALTERHDLLSLEQILAYVQASGWDAGVLLDCFPAILARVEGAGEALEEEVCGALHAVWEHAYPGEEHRDLASHLATLLYEMGYLPEALDYYQRSLRLFGPSAGDSFGMGMCHYRMQHMEAALACMDQALSADPAHEIAQAMRIKIRSRLGRGLLHAPRFAGVSP